MSVNLSIKHVPDHLANQLRRRAERHHRSLQGELMAILEAAVESSERLEPAELLSKVRRSGLATGDDAMRILRSDRDAG